jgi:hypothetical protein
MSKLFLNRTDARIISQVRRLPQINRLKEILVQELHRRRLDNEKGTATKANQAAVNATKDIIAVLFDDELEVPNG